MYVTMLIIASTEFSRIGQYCSVFCILNFKPLLSPGHIPAVTLVSCKWLSLQNTKRLTTDMQFNAFNLLVA